MKHGTYLFSNCGRSFGLTFNCLFSLRAAKPAVYIKYYSFILKIYRRYHLLTNQTCKRFCSNLILFQVWFSSLMANENTESVSLLPVQLASLTYGLLDVNQVGIHVF